MSERPDAPKSAALPRGWTAQRLAHKARVELFQIANRLHCLLCDALTHDAVPPDLWIGLRVVMAASFNGAPDSQS